jgi:hypothetical protein
MSVLRLSVGGVSFRHHSCVAGHGPEIRVVTVSVYDIIRDKLLKNKTCLVYLLNKRFQFIAMK